MDLRTQEGALDLRKPAKKFCLGLRNSQDRIEVVAPSTLHGHSYWPVEPCLPASQQYYVGPPLMYHPRHVTSAQLSPLSQTSSIKSLSPPARAVEVRNPLASNEYEAYEKTVLEELAAKNGGSLVVDNPRMRRVVNTSSNKQDEAYIRQREKNNAAAKASRDRRKERELTLSVEVTYLKEKVVELEKRLAARCCSRCKACL